MNAQINRAESEAARDGISNAGVVSSELTNARDEAENLMMEVMQRNQKIFKVTALVTLLARSEQELKQQTDTLKQIISGHLCLLRSLNNREEIAFNTCLPLAQMNMEWDRILTTEASCAFFRFLCRILIKWMVCIMVLIHYPEISSVTIGNMVPTTMQQYSEHPDLENLLLSRRKFLNAI